MSTEYEFAFIKQAVEDIQKRNARVEADKAWETSWTRILSITIITYVLASIVLWFLNIERPLLSALIPTLGFFLSVQSLPFIKKLWVRNYQRKQ